MIDEISCHRCGRVLREDKAVWLEMDTRDGTCHERGHVPREFSQGWFPFGEECAILIRLADKEIS